MFTKCTVAICLTILCLSCAKRSEQHVDHSEGDTLTQEEIMPDEIAAEDAQYPNLVWDKGIGRLAATIDCKLFKQDYPFPLAKEEWRQSTIVAFGTANGQTTAAQHEILLFFLANQEYYKRRMEEAIANYIQTEVKRLVEPEEFLEMEKKDPADLVLLHHVHIPYEFEGVLGFEFECVWDVEHGMGIKFSRGLITDIGLAEVAF